jgi:solute:Na+ symporter, SSS family
MNRLSLLDLAVLLLYLAGVLAIGWRASARSRSAAGFTAGGGSMAGWLVGLSIFGTYVSSISFLAVPGKAFTSNWNSLVFSLSIPLAAVIAVKVFVPFYRAGGEISAYHHLEKRFGGWARTYAASCYLLTQMARMGSILFLLALPLNQLLGWDIRLIILFTGLLTAGYAMVGGITAVIWTDAMQSVVLIAGALLCVILLPLGMPEGPGQLFQIGAAEGKFGLGSFDLGLVESTFWVVLIYGFFINLQNFGIDQSYVQRYLAARSDGEARKSVWVGALLYVPVSLCFFFIGTGLYAYYTAQPDRLDAQLWSAAAEGKGDGVFPFFIVNALPSGISGLLIAAIFAAAMSTVSTSLNSAATLSLTDFYKRYRNPGANDRQSLRVLRMTTAGWAVIGTGTALAMTRVQSVLDAWWQLAGIFSGGMLGLFLLGLLARGGARAGAPAAVALGVGVILWMTLSPALPETAGGLRSPFHSYLTIVFGTLVILLAGFALSALSTLFRPRK